MKVLLIIPEFSGTIAKVSNNLYKALNDYDGIELYVAVMSDIIRDVKFDFGENVHVFNKSEYGKFRCIFERWNFLRKLKKELSIDLAISTVTYENILNAITKRNDKTIGIFHAPLYQAKLLGRLVYCALYLGYKFCIPRLDKIVAVSETVKQDLLIYIKKPVEVIYNIHDFDAMTSKSNEDVISTDKRFFLKPYIVFVGGLYDLKGPDRLIKAFAESKLSSNMNLIFVAPNVKNNLSRYERLSEKLGVKENVVFLGYRENPYPYIKKATLLVSPSRSEGLPGVIIESLFLGTPVVSTNSSIGVFEIMECVNRYDANLAANIRTNYGIITPNIGTDEDLNVRCLASAMVDIIKRNDMAFSFDYSRFSKENVINKLLVGLYD